MNRETSRKWSFGLNAVLIGVVILLATRRPPPQPDPAAAGNPEATTNESDSASSLTNPKPNPNPQVANKPATNSDWRQWIDTMRAAGVPNRVLARLVLSDFDDRWQKREDDLQRQYARGELDSDAVTALQDEREREQEKELRTALGEEGFKEWDRENLLNSINLRNVKLTGLETNTIYAMQKDLQRRFHELEQARRKGEMDETDFAEQQGKIQAAFDQRLKTLLGDDRYAMMQGIEDKEGELRRSLKNLSPTDTQFQDLLAVQRQWTERRAELDRQLQETKSMDAAYAEQIQSIDQARDQEYQRVLGTNVFDAYQKNQDSRYLAMKRYAGAWGIDEQNMDYIYRTIKYYEKNVEDYRRDAHALERQGQAVDWEAVNKNLRQFSDQTSRVLQNYLGDDRFNRMQRNQLFPFEQ